MSLDQEMNNSSTTKQVRMGSYPGYLFQRNDLQCIGSIDVGVFQISMCPCSSLVFSRCSLPPLRNDCTPRGTQMADVLVQMFVFSLHQGVRTY